MQNLMCSLFAKEGTNFYINGLGHITKWPPCTYMVKSLKMFFSKTRSTMILNLGMQHQELKLYKVYINDDPGLTLTYFTVRSNRVTFE